MKHLVVSWWFLSHIKLIQHWYVAEGMQEIKLDKQSILQRLNGCCEDLIKPQTSDVQFTLRAPLVKMQQTNKQTSR